MKYCAKFTILTSLLFLQLLFCKAALSQELKSVSSALKSGNNSGIITNFSRNPANPEEYLQKKNRFKIFKSIGLKFGFTTNEYGWHHPFPFISNNYYDDPGAGTGSFGAYIEGLNYRYFTTVIEALYRGKHLNFKYNLYNGSGQVISTDEAGNTFNMAAYSIYEKIGYSKRNDNGEWGFYAFGGIRYNVISTNIFDKDLINTLNGYRSDAIGLYTGIGASGGKKVIVSFDFYFAPDISKTYSTANGYYKNTEFGFLISVGYNNF